MESVEPDRKAPEPPTGARNETSVLFSLATLTAMNAPPKSEPIAAPKAAAEDIVNLSGGGAFASLLTPPEIFEVPAAPVPDRRTPVMLASIAAAALVIATTAVVTIARANAPARTAGRVATTDAPVTTPSASSSPTAGGTPTTVENAKQPDAPPPAVTTTAPIKVRARPTTRTSDPSPVASAVPPTKATATPTATVAAPKCCAGESEMACQMRIAVGAACGTR